MADESPQLVPVTPPTVWTRAHHLSLGPGCAGAASPPGGVLTLILMVSGRSPVRAGVDWAPNAALSLLSACFRNQAAKFAVNP